mmetsp:Transcript_13671/g.42730  ORF Transcript_13671/g.42730 Transcript_13671/m.42730 type:complete len:272 (-) Transcript_13671:47-862(-)
MAWQTLLVLFGLALALSGCGGGGDAKKPNTSPAELTSQSVTGDWSGKISLSGTDGDFTSHLVFHFDADALNLRVDGQVSSKKFSAAGTMNFSMIVHAGNKRVTAHLKSKQPLPVPACIYKESPKVPPVELIKTLIKDQMQARKPDGMDGDCRQWKFSQAPVAGASVNAWADLDDNNGFCKFYESVKADSNGTKAVAETTFTASDVKIAKPDAGLFVVPKEWEPCIQAPNATAAATLPEPWALVTALLEKVASSPSGPVGLSDPESEVTVVV